MVPTSSIIAWIAVGFAAALVAGVLPFFRGALGPMVNMVAGIAGALAGGILGRSMLPSASIAPLGLMFALGGAFVAIVTTHVLWSANQRRRHA